MAKDKQKKHELAEEKAASGKMKRKEFEKELAKLQVELVRLQTWVRAKHARVIVVFEGRDTAGKGGVISRITARTSPRVYRHIALPSPSDREKTQVYIQRYIAHFPAAGEIILFDRSWYNRAGVERVMGFCTEEQCERFLTLVPTVEQEMISRNGIILRKYFLDVSQDEQRRRFEARIKHWKLSPMDTELVRRWWDYTAAYQRMIKATHTPEAPWHIVPADDKRRARLNLIRHLLDSIPLQEGQHRPAEDPEGANATQGCHRRPERGPPNPRSLLSNNRANKTPLFCPPPDNWIRIHTQRGVFTKLEYLILNRSRKTGETPKSRNKTLLFLPPPPIRVIRISG